MSRMKIYCLLIDALPLIDEIKDFAEQNGFSISHQIGSCYTTPTLYNMFTGQQPSDLLHHGVGYHYIGRDDINTFKWFENEDIHLVDILKKNNYQFNVCGNRHSFFMRDLLCLPVLSEDFTHPLSETIQSHQETYYNFDKYKNAYEAFERFSHVNLFSSNPNKTNDLFWEEYKNPEQREAFYQNEKLNIAEQQRKKEDLFCFWQNLEWSDHTWGSKTTARAESIQNVMEWLSFWNFDEEDAYFWIFSDHGDAADELMSPKSYMSWAITKDNTKSATSSAPKSMISSVDFYKTILNKLDYNKDCAYSRDIYEPLDPNRLYFFEDSRMHSSLTHANAASVVSVEYDNEGHPASLIQLSRHMRRPSPYIFQYNYKTDEVKSGITVDSLGVEKLKSNMTALHDRIAWLK